MWPFRKSGGLLGAQQPMAIAQESMYSKYDAPQELFDLAKDAIDAVEKRAMDRIEQGNHNLYHTGDGMHTLETHVRNGTFSKTQTEVLMERLHSVRSRISRAQAQVAFTKIIFNESDRGEYTEEMMMQKLSQATQGIMPASYTCATPVLTPINVSAFKDVVSGGS